MPAGLVACQGHARLVMTGLDPRAEIAIEDFVVCARAVRGHWRRGRFTGSYTAAAIDMKRSREHLDRRGIRERKLYGSRIAAHKLAQTTRLRDLHTEQTSIVHNAVFEGCVGVKRALIVGDREPCPFAQ